MAQCRSTTRSREALTARTEQDRELDSATSLSGDGLRASTVTSSGLLKRLQNRKPSVTKPKAVKATYKKKTNVERKRITFSVHSNMKTKQVKEDSERTVDEEAASESSAKTRSRKKAATEAAEEERSKLAAEAESKVSKKNIRNKITKTVVRKRPLNIQKTLRNKKIVVVKDKLKNVIKQRAKRGRKPTIKTEPASETEEKDTPALVPVTEIKDELIEEVYPNSRSSSPKTAGRRPRVSSDIAMMKSVLGDSPNSLVLGPRTSPYSMRSERSNSPSIIDNNRRSGRPRKLKTNLLNEVVKNEQKKRRRLLSDSKTGETMENTEENKRSKRGRSCSRDDSEFSKCSDVSESDVSLLEPPGVDVDKEPDKRIDKSKTDLVVDNGLNLQISTDSEKVPSLDAADNAPVIELDINLSAAPHEKTKKKLSLKRSTSLDSDNNNSNRLKLENLRNSADIDDKSNVSIKTENDTLFSDRSSILTSMSKTFNSKEVSKNIRRARRGRRAAAVRRTSQPPPKVAQSVDSEAGKGETLESISKEINDLIQTLDVSDAEPVSEDLVENVVKPDATNQIKTVTKFYNLPEVKPLTDNNSLILGSDTMLKDKDTSASIESSTPSKNDDSENMRLHFEGDESPEKTFTTKEITYKCTPIAASIDKLMDRLKTFEEFDKKRQHELMKSNESKPVMVTNDVVLIPKSGVDVKPLKDLQPVKSPEKPIEKENVLSCFENNSAISIVKRDQVRKSVDIDLTNSVTLIKRNSLTTRKESTGSNHSRESNDAISIFEKSLGKDVTLTEIRKSADKSAPTTQIELHQFATLHPNNPVTNTRAISLDSSQISIMPRVSASDVTKQPNTIDVQLKRHSRDSLPRKLSESANDPELEKMATIERIKSPVLAGNQQMKPSITITSLPPVAVKSPEVVQPMETEVLAPPLESVKMIPENMPLTSEVPIIEAKDTQALITKISEAVPNGENLEPVMSAQAPTVKLHENIEMKTDLHEKQKETETKTDLETKSKENYKKPPKSPMKGIRSKRVSSENQPGTSNAILETPENQRKKENVLRTLGLITHKAAKEARIMKQKEKERIYAKAYGSGLVNKAKTAKTTNSDYTGTLKTVIKLNRSSGDREKGKKYKTSLKMTFQKSKNRNGKPLPDVEAAGADDTYYTIERREAATTSGGVIEGGHRKSHYSNRLNYDTTSQESTPELSVESGKEATLNLVIPEKASSFSIHPGRLCMDQCFYCGGKFGLFDTPCHIAQMKSTERQKKVLDNEEKLTVDSCLCDACYRHVDRRANCPSYRRNKPAACVPTTSTAHATTATGTTATADATGLEKLSSPPLGDEESEEESGAGSNGAGASSEGRAARCHTAGCTALANHDIPRKWLIKMRPSVNKLLQLELDYPGLHTIPLCGEHYRALAPLMVCVLCRRRITKHHKVHTITQDYKELNPLLSEVGIPVQFTERPVLCKLCRYYCSLLQRPNHNVKHERNYRRRLLQLYNVEVPPDSEGENNYMSQQNDILNNSKQKKKAKTKSKQRKSSDPKQDDGTSRERTSESSPEKILKDESNDFIQKTPQNMEEDIESLISSNKILVPGASKPSSAEPSLQSDNSDAETLVDYDAPLLPLDKQTELQYLLQKQNNPAQFLQKPNANLTQKQKSMLKIHNSIQKPGQQHRIHDKNAKRIQKLGQIVMHKEKPKSDVLEMIEIDKPKEIVQGISLLKNMALNEECTIETVPNKKPADINMLKNKWQMSESFTQVKKNLSELSKNLSGEKITKKASDARYLNPVKRLETNPSISVRELFPGEEEMNLQCNIEFNNVRGVTPEGWEKCNTTIQYDVETKKLWNELQRPYGNQSSFLRHLVLLEKYFRNGDLILAHNATTNAVNYSDSVQSRLRAYDNVTGDSSKKSEPVISLIEYRKQKSTTSVPTNGKSLLKSNQITSDTEKPKSPEGSKKQFLTPTSIPKSKPNKAESKNKPKPLPPELIAINTPNAQGRKAIQNVLHNIQQLVKGVSAADPTEVAAAPLPHQPPRVELPKKQKTTKPWRPTLMPITQENLARIAREPLQLAVDGRSLPSLVQVMSSGNRYHITLQDYNKMCVMRREKLQQLHDGDTKRRTDDTTLITEIQPSAMLGNGGTLKQTISSTDKFEPEKSKEIDLAQIGTNAATILKNVGLKNITIAPIPAKPATVTSQSLTTASAANSSLLIAGAPVKMPQFGPAVSITGEAVGSPLPVLASGPIQITGSMVLPKIPKSLTVIPQMMPTSTVTPAVTAPPPDKLQGAVVPMTAQVTATTDATRP